MRIVETACVRAAFGIALRTDATAGKTFAIDAKIDATGEKIGETADAS